MPSISTQFEWAGLTLDIDFEFTQGAPAKLYGPPEDCYPAEPNEIDRMDITIHGEDFDPEGILYWEDVSHRVRYDANKKVFTLHSGYVVTNQEKYKTLPVRAFPVWKNNERQPDEYRHPVMELKDLVEEIDNHCYDLAAEYED